MSSFIDRRQFAKLVGLGGVVFASGLGNPTAGPLGIGSASAAGSVNDFFFVQLSDTHWGFKGPPNPEAANTLKLAVEAVNALPKQPDFIVFTGDLTHTTDDVAERKKRMGEFRDIIKGLKTQDIRLMPGEHDASLDKGAAFQEFFGPTHYIFDHKGVHFIVLDNVSDPTGAIGEEQLKWLADDLKKQGPSARIVVFTHRPLFDLYPEWDWATRDGKAAIDLLMPHENVTVLYGHIHQENHFMTGHIGHHAATSLIFPLPAPGSQEKRAPLAWNPDKPFNGLGWREVTSSAKSADFELVQMPVKA
jgi:3',5'-cyclic AMP phosphodiesterase CpdA